MARLRNEGKLKLGLSPIYALPESLIRLSFLNARSLHKHIEYRYKCFFQRRDSRILIVILCIKSESSYYFEMILFHIMNGHMVELQCIVVSTTILDIHTATIKMA